MRPCPPCQVHVALTPPSLPYFLLHLPHPLSLSLAFYILAYALLIYTTALTTSVSGTMPSARPTSPSADSAPLLPSDSQHFTIDGSTYSDDECELDADGAPKYPPAAPPPSYAQVYGHSSGERSFARYLPACLDEVSLPSLNLASIPDKIKAALFKVYVFVLRAWPNSRLGQAGLALAGMWIILIFGGPAFEESSGGARGGGGGWWGGMSVGDIEIDEVRHTQL